MVYFLRIKYIYHEDLKMIIAQSAKRKLMNKRKRMLIIYESLIIEKAELK